MSQSWAALTWTTLSLAVACVCLAASPAHAEYRNVEIEGLRITVDSDWTRETAPGYLPVRLEIANLGDPREIEIRAVARRFFRGRYAAGPNITVSRVLRIGRGGRTSLTLPVPIGGDNESIQLELREGGETVERLAGWSAQGARAHTSTSAVILVHGGSPLEKASDTWPRDIHTSSGMPPGAAIGGARRVPPRDLVLDPLRAPGDWLGWTSVSAVFLGADEWSHLNEPQRTALRTWAAAGGDLVLVDAPLSTLFPGEPPPDLRASGDIADFFFGRIHLAKSDTITTLGIENTLTAMETTSPDSRWSLPVNRSANWGTTEARGFRLAIPGVEGVPTRAYLVILLLFSVLIGPVNYLFLKRRGMQVIFVLTAPVVAVAFIALLAGYVIVGEGFGVRGRAFTFTKLDQDRRQASTRAIASLYAAGRTPSGGLDFPSDLAVFPTGPDGGVTREDLRIDLTDSQRVASGAIRARSATNIETVGFRTARERLGFEWQGDQVSVVNGLGQTVNRLVLRDAGRYYKLTTPLAPGSRAVLTSGGLQPLALLDGDSRAVFSFGEAVANQPDHSYLAVLERSPFWEAGTENVDERGSVHVVLGTGVRHP